MTSTILLRHTDFSLLIFCVLPAVSKPAYGLKDGWTGRIVFDFQAQPADIDGSGVCIKTAVRMIPKLTKDPFRREDLIRMFHEQAQKTVFAAGQIDLFSVPECLRIAQIKHDIMGTKPAAVQKIILAASPPLM